MRIETERIILREWKESDVEDLVEGLNKYEVAKNLTTPFPYTEEHAATFINKHKVDDVAHYYFAVEFKENGKVIGGTSLDMRGDRFNGGIWLNKRYQGVGLGTEVWIARAKFAFEKLGVNEIECSFYDYNNRSWHMQEKIGFKIIGETIGFCPALNKEVREVITLLKKEDFYKAIKEQK